MNASWMTTSEPMRPHTAKVLLGYSCNNHCVFCYDRYHKNIPAKTTQELREEISSAFRQGFPRLLLMGGEPTIRRDIMALVAHARKTGFHDIMLTTNGRMLAYPRFVSALVASGVSQIVISLCGPVAGVHDALTGSPGSFEQLMRGVENVRRAGVKNLGVNTTVVAQNYKYLPAIADMLLKWRIQRTEFIYVAADRRVFRRVTPRVSEAAAFINDALGRGKANGYFWKLVNAPLPCYFGPFFDHLSYAGGENNTLFVTTRKTPFYQKAEAKKRVFWTLCGKCARCSKKHSCRGISMSYRDAFGDKEVRPLS